MIVDTFTGFRWSHFYETNNGMIKQTCKLFQKWKDMNIPVKIFKSDNTGEKNKLEQRCISDDWEFGINFDYTERDMPQQNSEVEVGVLAISNRGL